MRVLFLDVDGVLNTTEEWYYGAKSTSGYKRSDLNMLRLDKVALLNYVCKASGCNIVFSTDWCKGEDGYFPVTLGQLLQKRGFSYPERILGKTFDLSWTSLAMRGDDIIAWLKFNAVSFQDDISYLCVDDLEPVAMVPVEEHTVFTDPDEGLTAEKAEEIVTRFQSGNTGAWSSLV
jgi:hypothetical protein